MKPDNEDAGPVGQNDGTPALLERAITPLIVTLYRGKHYIVLVVFLFALATLYAGPIIISKVKGGEVPTRPRTGAEITNSGDRNNMPREFTLQGNIWGIPPGKKPQLQIQTDEGYFYRDIAIERERFTRERTHLGVVESKTGKKDPDAGKAFRLQIILIDGHVIPNRHRLEKQIPCVPISDPVTFIRRAMLPGEA